MKILVPTSGAEAARETAGYVMAIAKGLGADVVAMHILRTGETEADSARCSEAFLAAGREAGVSVRSTTASGEVVRTIVTMADEIGANLVVMGASQGKLVDEWISADVMERSDVPVLVMPHCFNAQTVNKT